MLDIFTASCENERELRKQANQIKRLFNDALRKNRDQDIEALTKIYALIYSAYVEVSFLKTIHTPHGFDESYISQIQSARNIEEKWSKCIDLAFGRIISGNNIGEINNKKQIVNRILREYIIDPSHIRNKIAHGQWKVCLNTDNTAINADLTNQINQVDFVKIDLYFNIYRLFAQCIEDLIESPYRAHYRFFYSRIVELQEYLDRTKNFSIEGKRLILQGSPKSTNCHVLRGNSYE